MKTINNTDAGNGMAPPEELKPFAQTLCWDRFDWEECPPHNFDTKKQAAWFDWKQEASSDDAGEAKRIWLTRVDNLPAGTQRRYYVSQPFSTELKNPTCFCAVYELDGYPSEYVPEKELPRLER